MKIITAQIPLEYIAKMDKFIEEYGTYTSRSDLIRSALKEFLLKSLRDLSKLSE